MDYPSKANEDFGLPIGTVQLYDPRKKERKSRGYSLFIVCCVTLQSIENHSVHNTAVLEYCKNSKKYHSTISIQCNKILVSTLFNLAGTLTPAAIPRRWEPGPVASPSHTVLQRALDIFRYYTNTVCAP